MPGQALNSLRNQAVPGKGAVPAPALSLPAVGRLGMLWLSWHLRRRGGMLDHIPPPRLCGVLQKGFGGARGPPGGCFRGAGRPLGWRMDGKPRDQEHSSPLQWLWDPSVSSTSRGAEVTVGTVTPQPRRVQT